MIFFIEILISLLTFDLCSCYIANRTRAVQKYPCNIKQKESIVKLLSFYNNFML